MSKTVLILLVFTLLSTNASAKNAPESANEQSVDGYVSSERQEIELDDLIKNLEEHMKNIKLSSKEAYEVIDINPTQRDLEGTTEQALLQVNPNPRDRSSLSIEQDEIGKIITAADQVQLDAKANLEKRKIADNHENVDELKKEAYGLRNERTLFDDNSGNHNQLSDFEKDEEYYRALLRLQNLHQLYNKRYLDEDPTLGEDRASRHCTSDLIGKKMDWIQKRRLRYLEKSRLLADRIADSAMRLVRQKGKILDQLHRPCGCGSKVGNVQEVIPEPVVIIEEASKRDVEVSSASAVSSSSSLDASIGGGGAGVSVNTAVDTSSATATNIGVGGGGVGGGASISTSSAHSSDLHVGAGIGSGLRVGSGISTGFNSHLNVGTHKGGLLGFSSYLNNCEDHEKKMIMDMAIEEATDMIRKLALETKSEYEYRNEPDFERRVTSLAIDLVNKVTSGVVDGNRYDPFIGYRYNNVDDYLQATLNDPAELEADFVSNAGFDYLGKNQDLLDPYDDYVGHPSPFSRGSCDTCSKYDMRMGNVCPVCKRGEPIFQGRIKRKQSTGTSGRGKIYHLERLQALQQKVHS